MRHSLHTLFFVALVCLITAGGCNFNTTVDANTGGGGDSIVFVSVTSDVEDNPQAIDMAMKFAKFSLEEKRKVALFFNVKGVKVPVKSLGDDVKYGDHDPIKSQLAQLIKDGAEVHVCPVCMNSLGVKEEDLIEGAKKTDKPSLFANIKSNTTVFTY